MSWRGLKPKPTLIATPIHIEEWNAVIESLNDLYSWLFQGTSDISVKSITADIGNFKTGLYVRGKPVLADGDPVYVAGFKDDAKNDINTIKTDLNNAQQILASMQSILDSILSKLQDIATLPRLHLPRSIRSFKLQLSTTATPLVSETTKVHRIVLHNPQNSGSNVYLGDSSEQSFTIPPGTFFEVFVEDASLVYLRADNTTTVEVLLELA